MRKPQRLKRELEHRLQVRERDAHGHGTRARLNAGMDGALMQCSEDCALIRASKRMRLDGAKEVSSATVPELLPVQELFLMIF